MYVRLPIGMIHSLQYTEDLHEPRHGGTSLTLQAHLILVYIDKIIQTPTSVISYKIHEDQIVLYEFISQKRPIISRSASRHVSAPSSLRA
jgi:hypothetical protein